MIGSEASQRLQIEGQRFREADDGQPEMNDGRRGGRPSETALAMARRYRARGVMPDEAAEELRRLLLHHIAVASPARLRLGHLDLLFQIVAAFPDLLITESIYNAENHRRHRDGECHPDATTIAEHYGGWLRALDIADRFRTLGGIARVTATRSRDIERARAAQATLRELGARPGYQPEDIMRSIEICAQFVGDWPYESEFHAWAKLMRRRRLNIPHERDIRKAFDTYADALRITVQTHDLRRSGIA